MTTTNSPAVVRRRGGRLAVVTAVGGTVLIALGAFWLSFTALADLAQRSGIDPGQASAWPLIVDGISGNGTDRTGNVAGLNNDALVPPNGLKPNLQQRLERLETVWNRAKLGVYETEAEQQKQQDFDVVTQPSRPPRTPPTPEEVDAIRTARASGESVRSIAERFNKHRSTVWRYTKELR